MITGYRGYTPKIIELVKNGDSDQLGVKFAKFCIAKKLSIEKVSKELGVTRMTLYRWFTGSNIRKENRDAIKQFMKKIAS